jgi:hypothetical protein
MKIKNLRQGATLAPRLQEVLELVYAKRPLLEYEVIRYGDIHYADSVRAWQDGQVVGEIRACYDRFSPTKGMTERWYAIDAHTIKKQRGERNRKYCKDAKVAARTVIEQFAKKALAELGKSLIANVKYTVESMHEKVERDYRNSISFNSVELANYFTDVVMGNNPTVPKRTIDSIVSNEALRKRENYEIACNVLTHFETKNGYAIRVMQDETLLCAHVGNPDTTSKHQSTYELDQYTQEKFTMLKLLDMNQFAADIGIKYDSDDGAKKETIYFIVAGKTKVVE